MAPFSPAPQSRFARRRRRRGFTLVELMVAVTGGLFVALAVFAISRQTGRFYTRESRVADATLGAVVGFERLKADLTRAGFLSSPNLAADPNLCGSPTTYPALLRRLAPLRIKPGASPASGSTHLTANGLAPDELLLMGSFTGSEVFPIWNVEVSGTEDIVHLQHKTGPLGRMGYDAAADKQKLLEGIFGSSTVVPKPTNGRALRIQDQSGEVQYGTITRVDTVGGPKVVLNNTPALLFRETAGNVCGLKGNVTGATVNVVNFIRYDVRNIQASGNFNAAYTKGGHPYDPGTRFDLVRAELDTAGNEIDGTQEIISEYAVDFKLGIVHNTAPGNTDQTLQIYPADTDDAKILERAGDIVDNVTNPSIGPQRVRGVRVRLAVRSQEPDRNAAITAQPVPGLYRIQLGPSAYARVRSLQADVMLHNQTGVFY